MIAKIIFRNLLHKPLATLLSVVLLMFGTGIISLLLLLYTQIEDKFNNDLRDIDLVIGAKGSPLQLVLSAVYHMDAPTGNILQSDAEKIIHNPLIEQAIPLAYGDSYKTFRIVGTDVGYLQKYNAQFREGKIFNHVLDAVIGSNIVHSTQLKSGDTFFGTHGAGMKGHVHAAFQYKVTGILKETNTVLDNLVLTNIATVWKIHEHHDDDKDEEQTNEAGPAGKEKHKQETDSVHKPGNEITALLIKFRSPMGLMTLPRIINETTNMQSASPALEINRLFDLMGIGITTMQAVAFSIILISGLSVFISLYNRLKERKYELALARSMGSSRMLLFFMTLSEGVILAITGFVAGMLLARAGLYFLNGYSSGNYHINIKIKGLIIEELYLFLITMGIGITASFIPAIRAFNLNISKTLANE